MMRRFFPSTIRQVSGGLFFDQFENGLGGFSFRKLLSGYSGRWGRAINITTLEERDIGFVGDLADTADMVDLSNGTDTVELMDYDNSFLDVYFGPDPLRRPVLVISGVLPTIGGLPVLEFPVGRRITMSLNPPGGSANDPEPFSIYSLGKIDVLRQRNLSLATASGNYGYFHGGTLAGYDGIGVYTFFDGTNVDVHSLSGEDLNRRLGTYHWTDVLEIKMATNGDAPITFSTLYGAPAVRNIGVGQISSAQSFSGKIQEVLMFSQNKESDDAAIRANINSFYSVW